MSDVGRTWVAPPGWPQPPAGWSPPPGWTPNPAWGTPPPGWVWWQPQQLPPARSRRRTAAAVVIVVALLTGSALARDTPPAAEPTAQQDAGPAARAGTPAATLAPSAAGPGTAAASRPPAPATSPAAVAPLLVMAPGGDGDSWRDTDGVEYRMGLINAPETNECGGPAATAYRKRALATGFRADVYGTDNYGRKVAVVVAADGENLNVAMARQGLADDEYLERFRHENPRLAAQLDAAFAAAKAEHAGLWSACASGGTPQRIVAAPAPAEPAPAPAGHCHPDYATCVAVRGNGSGRGQTDDLDCADITGSVRLRSAGVDPYRLDADRDGVGCD